jgi:hypothetical protein
MDIFAALPLHQLCTEKRKKREKRKKKIKMKRKEVEHRLPMRVNVRVLIMPTDCTSNEGLDPVY